MIFDPIGAGSPTSEAGGGETKTQRIAMKFDVLVIDLGENHRSIDEPAQTIFFLGGGHPSVPFTQRLSQSSYVASKASTDSEGRWVHVIRSCRREATGLSV